MVRGQKLELPGYWGHKEEEQAQVQNRKRKHKNMKGGQRKKTKRAPQETKGRNIKKVL